MYVRLLLSRGLRNKDELFSQAPIRNLHMVTNRSQYAAQALDYDVSTCDTGVLL